MAPVARFFLVILAIVIHCAVAIAIMVRTFHAAATARPCPPDGACREKNLAAAWLALTVGLEGSLFAAIVVPRFRSAREGLEKRLAATPL